MVLYQSILVPLLTCCHWQWQLIMPNVIDISSDVFEICLNSQKKRISSVKIPEFLSRRFDFDTNSVDDCVKFERWLAQKYLICNEWMMPSVTHTPCYHSASGCNLCK